MSKKPAFLLPKGFFGGGGWGVERDKGDRYSTAFSVFSICYIISLLLLYTDQKKVEADIGITEDRIEDL